MHDHRTDFDYARAWTEAIAEIERLREALRRAIVKSLDETELQPPLKRDGK